ncbi:YjfA family protein [Nonomuraea sp. NBC_01738]|uniref:DUF2690 domain-containing protein n=1 Tax=Nonomuraea sp. NBC_01738 TaxID=2976003 RepID=UPI002E0E27A8|nr:YjfA family protein [Nonomuraea sp. NBC_01738]
MKFKVVAIAAATLAVAALTASPAGAATAGHPYDGKDPYTAKCSSGSYAVRSASTRAGTIKLMWSPRCGTNWTEIWVSPRKAGSIWVKRSGGKYGYAVERFGYKAGRSHHWGNMVYANNTCAWGSASVGLPQQGDVQVLDTTKACG